MVVAWEAVGVTQGGEKGRKHSPPVAKPSRAVLLSSGNMVCDIVTFGSGDTASNIVTTVYLPGGGHTHRGDHLARCEDVCISSAVCLSIICPPSSICPLASVTIDYVAITVCA